MLIFSHSFRGGENYKWNQAQAVGDAEAAGKTENMILDLR